jgi:hypothetical protein
VRFLATSIISHHHPVEAATFLIMASVSYLARSVCRRSFDKVVRLQSHAARVGSIRLKTYFTPGTHVEADD